jgi:hypothetical protein
MKKSSGGSKEGHLLLTEEWMACLKVREGKSSNAGHGGRCCGRGQLGGAIAVVSAGDCRATPRKKAHTSPRQMTLAGSAASWATRPRSAGPKGRKRPKHMLLLLLKKKKVGFSSPRPFKSQILPLSLLHLRDRRPPSGRAVLCILSNKRCSHKWGGAGRGVNQ